MARNLIERSGGTEGEAGSGLRALIGRLTTTAGLGLAVVVLKILVIARGDGETFRAIFLVTADRPQIVLGSFVQGLPVVVIFAAGGAAYFAPQLLRKLGWQQLLLFTPFLVAVGACLVMFTSSAMLAFSGFVWLMLCGGSSLLQHLDPLPSSRANPLLVLFMLSSAGALIAQDDLWLPSERVSAMGYSEPLIGYPLEESSGSLVFLEDASRELLRIPTSDIQNREFVSLSESPLGINLTLSDFAWPLFTSSCGVALVLALWILLMKSGDTVMPTGAFLNIVRATMIALALAFVVPVVMFGSRIDDRWAGRTGLAVGVLIAVYLCDWRLVSEEAC